MEASFNQKSVKSQSWKPGKACYSNKGKIKPLFTDLKQEVLHNQYSTISARCWNETLAKCIWLNIGNCNSVAKNLWCRKLKKYKIGVKELLALKLYSDFDGLQREYCKAYRCPFNEDLDRIRSFYHWHRVLKRAFRKFGKMQSEKHPVLFHGVNSIMNIEAFDGTYFGPLSTTTDLSIARSFAGRDGMILVLEIDQENVCGENYFKPVDLTGISEFPNEKELLSFNANYKVKSVIFSSSYDIDYYYYDCFYYAPHMWLLNKQKNAEGYVITDQTIAEPLYIPDPPFQILKESSNVECISTFMNLADNAFDELRISNTYITLIKFLYKFISQYNEEEDDGKHCDAYNWIFSMIDHICANKKSVYIDMTLLQSLVKKTNPDGDEGDDDDDDIKLSDIEETFSTFFARMDLDVIVYICQTDAN